MSAARVDTLLQGILRDAPTPGEALTRPSARRLRQHLAEVGLIAPLPAQDCSPADAPQWLVLRGRSGREHSPFQVMCATAGASIISHASALVFHELTQARISTHFVTVPRARRATSTASADPSPPNEAIYPIEPPSPTSSAKTRAGPAIGKLMFRFDGNEYRCKQTFEDLLFGVSRIWLDEFEQAQVFDRERTLLHTLTDPQCNGGVRVVLEAWERGAELLREARMLDYLRRLDIPLLWRRVGAISEHLQLTDLCEAAQATVAGLPPLEEPAPLVRDTNGGRHAPQWSLTLPW